jgi:hypothetical protein
MVRRIRMKCSRQGIMLVEMLVYLAIFSTLVMTFAVATTHAQRFLEGGLESTHRRYLLDRGLREIERDIRNARRAMPSWGEWKAGQDTLILEMPPGAPGAESGGAVVWLFIEGTLARGAAAKPDAPMPWTEWLAAVEPASVEFLAVEGAPGAVRVRVTRGAGNEAEQRLRRVWELVATPRG